MNIKIKIIIIFLIAFTMGYFFRKETTFIAINCDTTKYVNQWDNLRTVQCLYSNVYVAEETDLIMKTQLTLNKLGLYKVSNWLYKVLN
jgi:hypothetical protein